MDYMTYFSKIVTDNLQYILLAMMALIFMALIIFISINMKLAKLNKRYQKMMQGTTGANLEQMLLVHLDEVRQAMNQVDRLAEDCQRLDKTSRLCVQRIGVVRFSAFEDTGSDLSFAVALLDSFNNGVVLSSIFARNDSRTYAKPVIAGQSSYFLTDEEKRALAKAREIVS